MGMEGKKPYEIGGARDARRRAVAAVDELEGTLWLLDRHLRGIGLVGRLLRLRYHRQEERYHWRVRMGLHDWRYVGARVPPEVKRLIHRKTRRRVDDIELLFDIRLAGRSALRMIVWWMTEPSRWKSEYVRLVWRGEENGSARGRRPEMTWLFRQDGRFSAGGTYQVKRGVPRTYRPNVESLMARLAQIPQQPGPVTKGVTHLVDRLADCDRWLETHAGKLHGGCRVYYCIEQDAWWFQEILPGGRNRYMNPDRLQAAVQDCSTTRCGPCVPEVLGGVLAEARSMVERRRVIKRALRVIAVLAEGACNWPRGSWQLLGRRADREAADWVGTDDGRGVLSRVYEGSGQAEEAEGVDKQETIGEEEVHGPPEL